jgi:hypothetical protein
LKRLKCLESLIFFLIIKSISLKSAKQSNPSTQSIQERPTISERKNTNPKILKIKKMRIVASHHPNIERFEHKSF